MASVSLPSPAKINLFLEVLRRRADGYHELSTLFQEISLHDTLRVIRNATGQMTLTCSDPALPTGADNLVQKAARVFEPRTLPKNIGFRFHLLKRIPAGAGLGGGSGNAATTLKAIWSLLHHKRPGLFPVKKWIAAARGVGADVPFFLHGGLAEGRGVGDKLTPLAPRRASPYHLVLVFPAVFSATPLAFRALSFPLTKRRSGLRLKRALMDGAPPRVWADWLFNRLEEAVLPRLPVIDVARRALLRAGCLTARMSGSGSSVYGVVDSPTQGRRVLAAIRREPWSTWLVNPVLPSTPGGR